MIENVRENGLVPSILLGLCAALVFISVVVLVGNIEARGDDPKILVYHDDLKTELGNIYDGDDYPYQDCDVDADYGNATLGNYDVVFIKDDSMGSSEKGKLETHLIGGGRVYIVYENIGGLDGDLRGIMDVDITVEAHSVGDIDVDFADLDGTLAGDGTTVSEHYEPRVESYTLMESSGRTIGAYTVSAEDSEDGYRMMFTGLDILDMVDDSITVYDYLTVIMEWFTGDNINHSPIVAIDDDFLEPEDIYEVVKISEFDEFGDRLEWRNEDVDPWDQVPGAEPGSFEHVTFDVYVSLTRALVFDYDISTYQGTTSKEFFVPDLPESGYYYFSVVATDRYGNTTHDSIAEGHQDREIGEFIFDDENPRSWWIKPVFIDYDGDDVEKVTVGEEIGSDPSWDAVALYGKEYQGTPDYLAINMTDDYRLKMAGNSITEVEVSYSSTFQGGPSGQYFERLVLVGSNILDMALYENMDSRTVNMETAPYQDLLALNEEGELTMLIAPPPGFANPDGSLPDGWYTIEVMLRDAVANAGVKIGVFRVDYNEPMAAYGFEIGTEDYVDTANDEVFLQAGKENTLSFIAGTLGDDPTLNLMELQMSKGTKNYNKVDNPQTPENEAPNWITFKTWDAEEIGSLDCSEYYYEWLPSTQYDAIRVVKWDRAGNYNISDYFTAFSVDGEGPYPPSGLEFEVVSGRIALEGRAKDVIGGSDVSHIEVFLNDWETPIVVEDIYNGGFDTTVDVNTHGYFKVAFNLDPVGRDGKGDIRNAIRVRAVDNVGNIGTLSEEGDLPPIRIVKQGVSEYELITEQKPGNLTEDEDEVRELSLAILTFREGDNNAHTLVMVYHEGRPDGMPGDAVCLEGYWEIYCEDIEAGGAFQAELTLSYALKSETNITEESLILVTKTRESDSWNDTGAAQLADFNEFYLEDIENFSHFNVTTMKKPKVVTARIDSISPEPAMQGESVTFKGYAESDESIDHYVWLSSIDGQLHNDTYANFSTSALSAGNHSLIFMAMNTKGVWSNDVHEDLLVVSNARPSVSITSPEDSVEVSGTVIIVGTAADADGDGTLQSVELSMDYGEWAAVTGTTAWSYTWDTTSTYNGDHSLMVRAFDGAAYSETVELTLEVRNAGGGTKTAPLPVWQVGDKWTWKVELEFMGYREKYTVTEEVVATDVLKNDFWIGEVECYEIDLTIEWHHNGSTGNGKVWLAKTDFDKVDETDFELTWVLDLYWLEFPLEVGNRWGYIEEMVCVGTDELRIAGKDYECFRVDDESVNSSYWYSPSHKNIVKSETILGSTEIEGLEEGGSDGDSEFVIAGMNGYIVAGGVGFLVTLLIVVSGLMAKSRRKDEGEIPPETDPGMEPGGAALQQDPGGSQLQGMFGTPGSQPPLQPQPGSPQNMIPSQQPLPQQPLPQQPVSQQPLPQQPVSQQPLPQQPLPQQSVSQQPIPQQPVSQQQIPQLPLPQQPLPQQVPQQPLPQQPIPQQPFPQQAPAQQQPTAPQMQQAQFQQPAVQQAPPMAPGFPPQQQPQVSQQSTMPQQQATPGTGWVCNNCGKQLEGRFQFCRFCGSKRAG